MKYTYEYKSFQVTMSDRDMNQLGAEGWELVNHTAAAVSTLMSGGFGQYYVFKRITGTLPL